jgi:hypothetical protein
MLVTKSEITGPFETSEVIELLKNDRSLAKNLLWISPQCGAPLLFAEWMADYAPSVSLEELFQDEEDYLSLSVPQMSETGKRVELPPEHGGLTPYSAMRLRVSKSRHFLALVALAFLGLSLLWLGTKMMRPARSFYKNGTSLSAKLLGSTPEALRNYQTLLEGKIARDSMKYARALISLQKNRDMYPDGYLPSDELTTAIAFVNLSQSELDQNEEWKKLVNRLPVESRQKGLAVVAYELSRVFSVRKSLLRMPKPDLKKTIKSPVVQQAMDELSIIFERMLRVVPQSDSKEKIVQGMLLARVFSLGLITVLEFPSAASHNQVLKNSIENIQSLSPFVSVSDFRIVSELALQARQRMNNPKVKIQWNKSIENLLDINKQTQFLCQLNETGSGADAVLYMLAQASDDKQQIPGPQNLSDQCFVGLRVYPRVVSESSEGGSAGVLVFANSGPADEGLLRDFRARYPTLHPALNRLNGVKTPIGDWLLVLYQNSVLPGQLMGLRKSAHNKLCAQSLVQSSLCLQTRWRELSSRWRDLVPLVLEIRDDIKPDELSAFVQNFVYRAAGEAVTGRGRPRVREIREALGAVKDFVNPEDSQLQFIFDYVESLGSET